MTRVAAIDVGTNSVKLAVAEVHDDIDLVHEDSQITRLGRAVDKSGRLSEESMSLTLDVVARFASDARSLGAARIVVVGTSALRDAANGADFIDAVAERTGLDLEIITGDREARLALRAVSSDLTLRLDPSMELAVFDIGGGSTEVNTGHDSTVEFHESFNIGAVRLTERFFHSDPPEDDELRAAMDQAIDMFKDLPAPNSSRTGVGIGGTVTNASRILAEGTRDVHGRRLEQSQVMELLQRLAAIPLALRRETPGLDPARADVIVAGITVLGALMDRLALQSITVSTRGLRYGLLSEIAEGIKSDSDPA